MPRPRFDKLPSEKRERLLESAAKEFATHGYDDASLNQILEKAGVSKGAAYYYFDDKADLFMTVLDHYVPQIVPMDLLDVKSLTTENFWTVGLEFYRKVYLHAYDRPWAFGVLRASAQLYRANADHPILAAKMDTLWRWSEEIIHHGQALGVVRTDLPEDLILAVMGAVDTAADEWFLQHWQELASPEIERIATQTIDMIRRLLVPN
jgi:AcrR family transcriptional regulator